MADPSRRRVSFTQLETLWELLNKNRDTATGFNITAHAREYWRRMWMEVADQLNSLGDGATKDWKGWCKYWNDYKSKIKKMATAARSSHRQTGDGPSGIKLLTDIEKKFLVILGADFGEGLPGMRVEPIEEEVLEVPGSTAAIMVPSANASEEESPSILAMFPPAEQPSTQEPGPSWRALVPLSQATQSEAPAPPAPSTPRRSPRRRRLRRKPPMSEDAARRALIRVAEEKLELARHHNRIAEEKVKLERHRNVLWGALVEELREIKQILQTRCSVSNSLKKKLKNKKGKKQWASYDKTKIKEAIQAIRNKDMPIRAASRCFNIPRSTLQDRLSGRINDETVKIGRDTVLNKGEEETLVKWLVESAKCGLGKKRSDLINTVTKLMKDDGRPNRFKDGQPGIKWYTSFMKRHPELSQKTGDTISYTARGIVTEECIRKWFCELRLYLEEIGNEDILDDPTRVFNCDEISFKICPKTGKVIGPKDWKNIYDLKKGSEKKVITVLLVFSASGQTLIPMVVFPYAHRLPKKIVESAPSAWFMRISDSGWMKSDLFFEYIAKGFQSWLKENNIKRPVLLFVDGYKSHLTTGISSFCDENGIVLYALPPNTTHMMQPAEMSVFYPLKVEWGHTVREWKHQQEKNDRSLTKITFCSLLKHTLERKNITVAIINGFKRCGLSPFDPNAVDYTKCLENMYENLFKKESEEPIKDTDWGVTIKVINKCKKEFKNAGIDINLLKKIIIEKMDSEKKLEDTATKEEDLTDISESEITIENIYSGVKHEGTAINDEDITFRIIIEKMETEDGEILGSEDVIRNQDSKTDDERNTSIDSEQFQEYNLQDGFGQGKIKNED